MTHKERILAAINHSTVDRIPLDYWGTNETTQKLKKVLGTENDIDLWKKLDVDKIVAIWPPYCGPTVRKSGISDHFFDYWGIEYKTIEYGYGLGVYNEMCSNPLKGLGTIKEIKDSYFWPSADWFDYKWVSKQCQKFDGYAIETGYIAPFYMYSNIRGMEECLMDLAADEEVAEYILDNIFKFLYEYHERLFEATKGKIDIAQVTDDFGTQNGLLISIDMFDKYFKKQYKRFIELVKSYGLKVFHHDDGSIMELLPSLTELGIDVLNPIQWHLQGMNLTTLKKRFGDKICFHGGIDNQHVLPFGSLEDIRHEVKECISHLASDGTGYILAPCHNIQPNTPVENILEMYRIAREL